MIVHAFCGKWFLYPGNYTIRKHLCKLVAVSTSEFKFWVRIEDTLLKPQFYIFEIINKIFFRTLIHPRIRLYSHIDYRYHSKLNPHHSNDRKIFDHPRWVDFYLYSANFGCLNTKDYRCKDFRSAHTRLCFHKILYLHSIGFLPNNRQDLAPIELGFNY